MMRYQKFPRKHRRRDEKSRPDIRRLGLLLQIRQNAWARTLTAIPLRRPDKSVLNGCAVHIETNDDTARIDPGCVS
jgi:hypothetical protein